MNQTRVGILLFGMAAFFICLLHSGALFGAGNEKTGFGWRERVITEQELSNLGEREHNWDLSPAVARRLLARLNVRDFDYIESDIQAGRPLKVPDNFTRFKHWTPMMKYLPEAAGMRKLIVIIKDIPFIGWYENGKLVGDSYICIGRHDDWTRAGIYAVREKDIKHVSRSYPNAYGEPAPMPWALRIYETVWIHAGDITGGYCSHGCVNLPIFKAMALFSWAETGTPVLIVDSAGEVDSVARTVQASMGGAKSTG